jgi:hypothetical protein
VQKPLCILISGCIFLTGCRGAYHVMTAPVDFVHRKIDKPPATATSDVTSPGRSVPPGTSSKQRRQSQANAPQHSATPSSALTRTSTTQTKPLPSPKTSGAQPSFPIAKPVPGKPGYVFSPSEPGKYVDVSGYAPGSKVKDPYSGKIFLVP